MGAGVERGRVVLGQVVDDLLSEGSKLVAVGASAPRQDGYELKLDEDHESYNEIARARAAMPMTPGESPCRPAIETRQPS